MAGSSLRGEVRSLFSTVLNIMGVELEGDWGQVPSYVPGLRNFC